MLLFESRIAPDLLALSSLRKDVGARLVSLCSNEAARNAILLAISEMGANAIRHGDPEPSYLELRLSLEGAMLKVELLDDGGAFAGFEQALAHSLIKQAHLYAEGGRGLSIMNDLLDEIRYEPGHPNRFVACRVMASNRPTLLVVEDSPVLLETYAAILSADYHVLKSTSFETALTLARSEAIDAIVTDLHLEGFRGSELANALEANIDKPPVPVLVITSDRDPASIKKVLEAGVDQVLSKPVSAQALSGAVVAMLARAERQNARLFRYFGGGIDYEGEDRLPENIGPFRIKAICAKAGFGRGDFAFALRLEKGRRIILADVMGHGLTAQLAGMRFKAAIRAVHGAFPDLKPGAFMAAFSRALAREPVLAGSFLTIGMVDLYEDGRIEHASAGHPRAFSVHADQLTMIDAEGALPGLSENSSFTTASVDLPPGGRFFIPTDGLDPRAKSAGVEAPDWLIQTLLSVQVTGFAEALALVDREARVVLTHAPVDDWTLLAIERVAG